MIEIDGSSGEGGGQMVRTSLTLSAMTQKPVRITSIRAKRPKPGLQPQHLAACKAVRNVCRGKLSGAEIGSRELTFEPGPIVGGRYEFDIGTAGSVTLVAQAVMPILAIAAKASEIKIIGGTHVMKSPGYDYFERVFIPAVSRFGLKAESLLIRPGYYPRGGGIIGLEMEPSALHGCTQWSAEPGIEAMLRLSGLPLGIAVREKKVFVQNGIGRVHIRQDEADSLGNAVTAWNAMRGSYVLGEKGKRAETVAQEALDGLLKETKDVDMHLADQLLVYAAMAEGPTRYSTSVLSGHLKTNAGVISRFLDRSIGMDEKGEISVE